MQYILCVVASHAIRAYRPVVPESGIRMRQRQQRCSCTHYEQGAKMIDTYPHQEGSRSAEQRSAQDRGYRYYYFIHAISKSSVNGNMFDESLETVLLELDHSFMSVRI